MVKHLLIIAVIVCLASLFIFLPHFPGDYDSSSVIVSMYIQVLCFLGLVLVPIGIIWSIFETSKSRSQRGRLSNIRYRFTRFALVILFVIFLLADFMLFMNNYLSLAIIILLLTCYFFFRALLFFKNLKNANQISLSPFPVYIICIPLLVFFIRFIFIERAVVSGRKSAILHARQLISDIETFKLRNGHYPVSMLSVNKDYKTNVRGISHYHYEMNGKFFNIYFEQNSNKFGVREIVMYNSADEQEMTSHDQDLLLLTATELKQQRGYFKVQDLPEQHWKYFWFD